MTCDCFKQQRNCSAMELVINHNRSSIKVFAHQLENFQDGKQQKKKTCETKYIHERHVDESETHQTRQIRGANFLENKKNREERKTHETQKSTPNTQNTSNTLDT